MITRRAFLAGASAGATLAAFRGASAAKNGQLLDIVVGFPAGVVTDNIARVIADKLKQAYPAGVIVENKVGAGGRIAVEYVKRAKPDGNTLLLTPCLAMTIYPHVYRKLGYKPLTDFKAVAGIASIDYAITVGPAVPSTVKTLPDFIQWCRADTKRAMYGIPALGSTPHFIGVMLARATEVPFKVIPYNGGAQLIQDLIGGQIPVIIDPLSNALPYHREGRLRILAITGKQRSAFAPDVPTVGELKLGSLTASELFGFYVPAQVPDTRVQALQNELIDAARKAKERLTALEVNAEFMGREALASFSHREFNRWKEIVRASGFTVEN